ncbi:MAG: iron-containing alcohol dehydrogenase [Clostridiales Family XIII bacterium]|jgi:alcohol dehydrogenase|nr:iron-containing alcohol dehydrogenase [Clostridiales Family XIII bacterium]
MKDFVFKMPTRVHFGVGAVRKLPEICKGLGGKKLFIITGPNVAKSSAMAAVREALGSAGTEYEVYAGSVPDPPIEAVDAVTRIFAESGANMIVALGGGSPIDLAKAAAMLSTNGGSVADYLFGGTKTVAKPSVPLIAIPTTAGTGSEVTAASVITDTKNRIKLSVTHDYVIPKAALIDPQLQADTPALVTASTGMDALTHAIESYVSLNANPISDAMGIYAMRMIGENLRIAVADGGNMEARANMAVASLIAGVAFMNGGLGVVHGIAQAMGGIHHTPHGIANGVMLPYAMKRNLPGNFKKFGDIARALGKDTGGLPARDAARLSVDAVAELRMDIKVPRSLGDIGIEEKDFQGIIDATMPFRLLALNPCKLAESDVEGILRQALRAPI